MSFLGKCGRKVTSGVPGGGGELDLRSLEGFREMIRC